MFDEAKIARISSYLSPLHHIKGRIRVRVSPLIKKETSEVTIEDINRLSLHVKGIKSLKINTLIGSVLIEYDPLLLPPSLFDDLVKGCNLDEVTRKINECAKEVQSEQDECNKSY